MNEPVERFTGIFIPVEILEIENISYLEKFLLSWIDALHSKKHGGCFASNSYFAEKFHVEENTIAKSLTKLRKLKLIEDVSFDGKTRVIRAKIGKFVDQQHSKSRAACDKNHRQHWIKIQPALDKNPTSIGQKSNAIYKDDSKDYRKEETSQPALQLATLLSDKIKEISPKTKTNPDLWAREITKLLRLDNRTSEEIEDVINWTANNSFWRRNVLSGRKLREKFDQLYINMLEDRNSSKQKENDQTKQKIDRLKSNKKWAETFLSSKTFSYDSDSNHLKLIENGVEVKFNGGYRIIGFLEYGFEDQITGNYLKMAAV